MSYGDLFVLVIPWVATGALICSLVSFGFVVRSERRRRLRRKFRSLLRAVVSMPEENERELARLISTCVQRNDANPLRKAKVEQLFENYIVDLEFKVNLRDELVELVRNAPSPAQIEAVLKAIETWRSASSRSEAYVLQHIKQSAAKPKEADRVTAFLRSRPDYFENKTELLVKDVQDAVQNAFEPADAA